MRSLVVVGALGDVGHGIVVEGLARGWDVTAVARQRGGLDQLRESLSAPRLRTVRGSVARDDEAAALFADPAVNGADAVVTAVNSPRVRRPIAEWAAADLTTFLGTDLIPHFVAAKHAVKAVAAGGTYLAIGGGMADVVLRGHGHNSMVQAAQRMMLRALSREAPRADVHVRELIVASMVNGRSVTDAPAEWLTAAEIGRRACEIVADPAAHPGPIVTLSGADRPIIPATHRGSA